MTKEWAKDTAERVFWTFAEVFIAMLTVVQVADWNLAVAEQAVLSGVAAGLAVLKSAIASMRGGTISPASTAKS